MLSIWEKQSLVDKDIVIIGSGITGLSAAAYLGENYPDRQVTIIEKGLFPSGASTKNAGFACFGSLSEIVDDLSRMSEEEVLKLVSMRLKGLSILKERLGADKIGYQQYGGHELIGPRHEWYLDKIDYVNELISPMFGTQCFEVRNDLIDHFGFDKHHARQLVYTPFEGQLNTGLMMKALMAYVREKKVEVFTNTEITHIEDKGHTVDIFTKGGIQFNANQVLVANNGFVSKLIQDVSVKPGRGLVLATTPIKDLKIKGTFHIEMGYYYFRNLHDRIIFGGGRNLDYDGETSTEPTVNPKIMEKLQWMLKEVILPGYSYEIADVWTGIMGFGNTKSATLKALSDNVFLGVGLGGMGVAIGSIIGEQLAELAVSNSIKTQLLN